VKNDFSIIYRCFHYFSTKNCNRTQWIVRRSTIARSDCRAWMTNMDGSNLKLETIRSYNKERVSFIIYADLECILRKTKSDREDASSYTYQQHEIFSIGYYVRHSYDDTSSSHRFRRDEDCIAWFAGQLNDLVHRLKNIVSANMPMKILSKEQCNNATRYHICEKPFASDDTWVRDHCYLTGRYRGPAHSNCHLNYKNSFYIPIVFHNLSGYDIHFIIKKIATAYDGHVDVPITKENIFHSLNMSIASTTKMKRIFRKM